MQILEHLEDYAPTADPLILTIGNFDGMHRGHSAVLKQARSLAGNQGQVIALTFRNHPSEVLRPEDPTLLLCTLSHKLLLLQQWVDKIFLLRFTPYLAQHSAISFIEHIRQYIPFSHLVLGHDATLGRDRQGDRKTMQTLGMQWGFTLHYLEEYRYEGKPVSSTRIRSILQEGDLAQVELLLNRPYSIYGQVLAGTQIGLPTVYLDVTGLCLPPFGVYAVEIIKNSQHLQGVVNIASMADVNPILEVHLLEGSNNLYGQYLEVIFKHFIRPEKNFSQPEERQQQIQRDIESHAR